MLIRSSAIAISICLISSGAFAQASGQHSTRASNHGSQASGHSSAAILTGTATIVAVPIIAFGGVLGISGAALESVGNEAMIVGTDLTIISSEWPNPDTTYVPNGPPRLD